MAGQEILIPQFNFSGTYYAELIESLLQYKRENIPEISNENPFEVGIQMLRSYALIGHQSNVLLDLVGQEVYLPTAHLRDSVVRLLRLIGFIPHGNIPATSVLRAQLARGYTTSTLIVPDNALFGTRRRASTPTILFESDAAITVTPTDVLESGWLRSEIGAWTDYTAEVNGAGPANVGAVEGRALYLMHSTAFCDALEFEGVAGFDPGDDRTDSPVAIHYQYSDGTIEDAAPDSVEILAAGVKFYINGLVGSVTKFGAYAHAIVNSTGASERLPVEYDSGGNYITTSNFLGQTNVSSDPDDYTVGSRWKDVQLATDSTSAAEEQLENFATGNGADQTFANTLSRYPLEDATQVVWNYLSGALPKTAVYNLSDGTIEGDASIGTTVNALTGDATLVTGSVPDAATIQVTYQRKAATLRQDGIVSFLPPFNDVDDWPQTELSEELRSGGGPADEGYWFRILFSSFGAGLLGGFAPTRVRWDSNGLYIRIPVTQGQTIAENLASGDGTPSQSFVLDSTPVIDGSVLLTVDAEPWTQVEDFFASSSVDEHYTVTIDSDGVATILTGDGENGKIVPVGVNNVTSEYRIGGEEDGNVGSGQINVSRSGLSTVRNVTNPRPAFGWIPQEGSDELSLEKLKRDGVSSLRTLRRAVSPSDVEYLAVRWESDSQFPFSRARAIENGFGLKTVKLTVVPVGGGTSSATVRQDLDNYFNGDINEGGVEPGILVANQKVTSIDYSPRVIDIDVTVEGGTESSIRAALIAALQPEAVDGSGNFIWEFGQTVSIAKLSSIIFETGGVTNVTFTLPAADVSLSGDELPLLGMLDLEVV
jgi:hypothetical protein